MPSQPWPPFVGNFYRTRYPIAACDQAINIYSETRQQLGSPKQAFIVGTPGLALETTLATKVCRGWFSEDGRTWVVVGNTLYERTSAATFTAVAGVIPDDGLPVYFATNGEAGEQLAIVGGGQVNVLDLQTNVMVAASLPFTNPVMIVFQDGYGLVNERDTPTVWFSALEDFLSWDALDFFTRSTTSDNIIGLASTSDRVLVIGSKNTNLYFDSGDTDNPWLPYPGTSKQIGAFSASSISVYNDVVRWIGKSPRGRAKIVQTRVDMSIQTISTPPIDDVLNACATLMDAEQLTYEQNGHAFILWTCPSSPDAIQTYGYDVTESVLQQAPVWHARAAVDPHDGLYRRWRPRGSTTTDGEVLAGDFETGAIYTLELDVFDDAGQELRRERVAPYLSAQNQFVFIDQFELGTQAGYGLLTGQGSDPQVELWISRDGAQTWISAGFAPLGVRGDYLARAMWRQCGQARADRLVFKVRQTDPVPCCWTGAWPTLTPGTGQL